MNDTQVTSKYTTPSKPSRKVSRRRARQRKIRLSLLTFFSLLLVAVISFSVYAFSYSKSFPNIYVGETPVSGKTEEQIVQLLDFESERQYATVSFSVTVKDTVRKVTAPELLVAINSKSAAKQAMEIGHTGSVWNRFWTMLSCMVKRHTIPVETTMDEPALTALAKDVAKLNVMPVDASYKVSDDTLILYPAKDGHTIDETEFMNTIRNKFNTHSYKNIIIEPKVAQAKRLNLDEVYSAVHKETADAKLESVGNEHKIVPHVIGVDFDLKKAKAEYEKAPDSKIKIPLVITTPKVTTKMLEATLFEDTLSQQTTYFSPKKVARTENVRLAAKYINGTVLNPGEVFSFNDVVGPRTARRGFKEAQIFAAGEVVDGLGGGICQVSSTLYLASMKADLKTVSRRNHSFYVDYAPKSQDATVVYGAIDFKFENNTPYPIKILSYQQNNFIRVTIKGTKTEEKTVKIKTKTLSTTPFTEKIIIDQTLKPGERIIKQKGQEGMIMEAYRLVYDANNNLLRNTFENKTKYVPLTQIVHVGPNTASQPQPTPPARNGQKPADSAAPAPKPQPNQNPAPESSDSKDPTPPEPKPDSSQKE